MKQETILELCESFINGNISYVRGKVKRMSKIDFFYLLEEIINRGWENNHDRERVAHLLIG